MHACAIIVNIYIQCLQEAPGGYSRPQELGIKERPGRPTGQEKPIQQDNNDDDDDDDGDDQSDSSEEDDDDDDAHGTALVGYDLRTCLFTFNEKPQL